MTDPNKRYIDPRTTVTGEQPRAIVPAGSGNPAPQPQSTPGAATTQSASSTGSAQQESVISQGSPTSSATTVKKTTAVPISSIIPDEFKGSSGQELVDFLEKKVREYKPLTEKDLKKIRRRQKAEGIISGISDAARALSNLIFTTRYAPNMYDPKESMSAKAKARFEKEEADRKAKDDEFFNYAMTLSNLRNAEKDRGLQAWQTEQTLARQDRAYDDNRRDRADDEEFRNKDYDERVRQWQASFDRQGEWHKEEGERWERQFKESVREFNVSAANERARINMESQRLAHAMKEGQMTFNLGSGNGNVTVTLDKLNAQTVSRIFHTLPDSALYEKVAVKDKDGNITGYRKEPKIKGDPIIQDGIVMGYKPPTTEAMLIAIGANVENSPATQSAIKQVAGLETGKKPAGY